MDKQKSPQQKKQLSYAKDRRNTYGENSKSSRSSIRLRKRLNNRRVRKNVNQLLQPGSLECEELKGQPRTFERWYHITRWQKWPDSPLSVALKWQIRRRLRREASSQDS